MIDIVFERDSVCMGDDVSFPNTRVVHFAQPPMLSEILREEGPVRDYLPCVHRTRGLWQASIDGCPVADFTFVHEPVRRLMVAMLVPDRPIEATLIRFRRTGQEHVD